MTKTLVLLFVLLIVGGILSSRQEVWPAPPDARAALAESPNEGPSCNLIYGGQWVWWALRYEWSAKTSCGTWPAGSKMELVDVSGYKQMLQWFGGRWVTKHYTGGFQDNYFHPPIENAWYQCRIASSPTGAPPTCPVQGPNQGLNCMRIKVIFKYVWDDGDGIPGFKDPTNYVVRWTRYTPVECV